MSKIDLQKKSFFSGISGFSDSWNPVNSCDFFRGHFQTQALFGNCVRRFQPKNTFIKSTPETQFGGHVARFWDISINGSIFDEKRAILRDFLYKVDSRARIDIPVLETFFETFLTFLVNLLE